MEDQVKKLDPRLEKLVADKSARVRESAIQGCVEKGMSREEAEKYIDSLPI